MGGVCDHCGTTLPSRRKRWCAPRCESAHRAAQQKAARHARGLVSHRAAAAVVWKIGEAKAQYPSLSREWTADMIDQAARSNMLLLIAQKLERYDNRS